MWYVVDRKGLKVTKGKINKSTKEILRVVKTKCSKYMRDVRQVNY